MLLTSTAVRGYRRGIVEDRVDVIRCGQALVLVVADGAGGRSGAAEAADAAVRAIRERILREPVERWQPHRWSMLLADVDGLLSEDPASGETTAVVACVSSRGIAGASVGDSEAWLVGAGGVDDLTEDQHRKPCLGTGAAFPVPFGPRPLSGTLLLGSDGLFKYADPDAIAAAARDEDLEHATARLLELVRLPSGALPDDVAVILCRPAD
jgi:serine/threonine protein phosphatase PrpC